MFENHWRTIHNPTMNGTPWYRFARWFIKTILFGPLGGLKGVGQENVPMTGGLIVAPVHLSFLDPPAVACGTRRALTFMAKKELFWFPFGNLIRSLGAFPVSRGEGDLEAIRRAIGLLADGHAVLVFPEGTRGYGKSIESINRGVAMLAKKTDALVMPVAIVGTHRILPRNQKFLKRSSVVIAYGKPFRYSDVPASTDKEARQAFAAELEKRLLELCHANGLMLKASQKEQLQRETVGPE
jgi:1-acyl-sn-glycerol-3-phosphate acyltransferase